MKTQKRRKGCQAIAFIPFANKHHAKEYFKTFLKPFKKQEGKEFTSVGLSMLIAQSHPLFKGTGIIPEKFRFIWKTKPDIKGYIPELQGYFIKYPEGEKLGWRPVSYNACLKVHHAKDVIKDFARRKVNNYYQEFKYQTDGRCEECNKEFAFNELDVHHDSKTFKEIFEELWEKHFSNFTDVEVKDFYEQLGFQDFFHLKDADILSHPKIQAFMDDVINYHSNIKVKVLCPQCHKAHHQGGLK